MNAPLQPPEFRRMVHRHVLACAEEARRDFASCASTPSGASMVAIGEMMMQIAWSLGNSFACNGLDRDTRREQLLADARRQFDDGFAKPGEGVML